MPPALRAALFEGFTDTDGEEVFAGLVWYRTYTSGENAYVLAHNADTVSHTVTVPAPGTDMALIMGDTASLSGGFLTLSLSPGSFCFLREVPGDTPGLYRDGILLTRLEEGTFTFRNASFAAVYGTHGGNRELLGFYLPGAIPVTDKVTHICIFNRKKDGMPTLLTEYNRTQFTAPTYVNLKNKE